MPPKPVPRAARSVYQFNSPVVNLNQSIVLERQGLGIIGSWQRTSQDIHRCRVALLVMACLSSAVVVYQIEVDYPSTTNWTTDVVTGAIMSATAGIGAALCILMLRFRNERLRSCDPFWKSMTWFQSPSIWQTVAEVLVWLIHLPPLPKPDKRLLLLNCVAFLRLYTVVLMFKSVSPIHGFKMRSLAYFARLRVTSSLIIRTQLNETPVRTVAALFASAAVLLAGFFAFVESAEFSTSLWFIFVTSTTVGYGDVVPRTAAGRLVTVCSVAVGLLLVSYIIGAMQSRLSLSPREHALLTLARLDECKTNVREGAGRVLGAWWRYRKYRKAVNAWRLSKEFYTFRQSRLELNEVSWQQKDQEQSASDPRAELNTLRAEVVGRLDRLEQLLNDIRAEQIVHSHTARNAIPVTFRRSVPFAGAQATGAVSLGSPIVPQAVSSLPAAAAAAAAAAERNGTSGSPRRMPGRGAAGAHVTISIPPHAAQAPPREREGHQGPDWQEQSPAGLTEDATPSEGDARPHTCVVQLGGFEESAFGGSVENFPYVSATTIGSVRQTPAVSLSGLQCSTNANQPPSPNQLRRFTMIPSASWFEGHPEPDATVVDVPPAVAAASV